MATFLNHWSLMMQATAPSPLGLTLGFCRRVQGSELVCRQHALSQTRLHKVQRLIP